MRMFCGMLLKTKIKLPLNKTQTTQFPRRAKIATVQSVFILIQTLRPSNKHWVANRETLSFYCVWPKLRNAKTFPGSWSLKCSNLFRLLWSDIKSSVHQRAQILKPDSSCFRSQLVCTINTRPSSRCSIVCSVLLRIDSSCWNTKVNATQIHIPRHVCRRAQLSMIRWQTPDSCLV